VDSGNLNPVLMPVVHGFAFDAVDLQVYVERDGVSGRWVGKYPKALLLNLYKDQLGRVKLNAGIN